jgi:spore maturation protein CgeB
MVPYSDIFHHFDPDPKYACDINFVATNYYDDFEGLSSSRRAIVEALTATKDIDTAIYGLDPGRSENRDAFKGPIRFEINRKVFSSCKLTLNLLVAAPMEECGKEHIYANERVTTAMASGGIQLVEDHYCLGGILENGKTAIFLRSTKPEDVVAQVRDIIGNFGEYEHVREEAILAAQRWHISGFVHNFVADLHALRKRVCR